MNKTDMPAPRELPAEFPQELRDAWPLLTPPERVRLMADFLDKAKECASPENRAAVIQLLTIAVRGLEWQAAEIDDHRQVLLARMQKEAP